MRRRGGGTGPNFEALEPEPSTPPAKLTTGQLMRILVGLSSVVALAMVITVAAMFLTLRTDVLAAGGTTGYEGQNQGGGGEGFFVSRIGNTFNFRTLVPGAYTSVQLDGNNNVLLDVVPSALDPITIVTTAGMVGGQPVALGGIITLGLNDAQSFTMLSVANDTFLGMYTTCMRPLQPSCHDISNQGCTTPVLQSCIPPSLFLDSLTVGSLSVVNMSSGIQVVFPSNQTSMMIEELFVTNGYLSGAWTCQGMGAISQTCLNLGGYTCPMGMPLADSCIPATISFTTASVTGTLTVNNVICAGGPVPDLCLPAAPSFAATTVTGTLTVNNVVCAGGPIPDPCLPANISFTAASVTDTLTVNNVVCAGGPMPDSCVPGTSLATPNTLVKRDGSAGFAAGPVTVSTLGATTTVTAGTDLIGVNFNPVGGGTFSSDSTNGPTVTAASNSPNGLSVTLPRTGLPSQLSVGTRSNVIWTGTNVNNIDRTYGVLGKNQVTDSTMSDGGLLTVSVASGGSGYAIGNTLTLAGSTYDLGHSGMVTVTAVDGLGAVTAVTVLRAGYGYTAGVKTTTGGVGTGATINILTRGNAVFAWAIGLVGQSIDTFGTTAAFTLTNSIGIEAGRPDLGNGPIRIINDFGVRVPNWGTLADNRYGVYIDPQSGGTMTNYALFFGASTTPSGGISFSTDAQLYRSGTASMTANGLVTTNAGSIGFTGRLTLNTTTASTLALIGSRAVTVISANTGSTGGLLTFSVNAGGSGYVVGNSITITGGSGTALLTVTTIGGGGVVTTLFLSRPGSGYTVSSGVATTGGAGTGLTVNILSIGTSTYTSVTGMQAQSITASGSFSTSTITTATALAIQDANRGSGPLTIGTSIGIDIPTLAAVSTDAIGLRIAAPSGGTSTNYALNFIASTIPSGGITYGTDTNLYRSGAGRLRTDTDMIVRHIEYTAAAVPTVAAGNAAGTAPTVTMVAGSTDCKMRVSVTAGAAIAAGTIATITYNTAFVGSVVGATFSPFTATAAAVSTSVFISVEGTGSITLASAISLASGTNYQWNIQVC